MRDGQFPVIEEKPQKVTPILNYSTKVRTTRSELHAPQRKTYRGWTIVRVKKGKSKFVGTAQKN